MNYDFDLFAKKFLKGPYKERSLLAFKLAYINGISIKEIAQLRGLGLNPSAVKVLLSRVRSKFRKYLAQKER
jgi:DNA-directed RNA polymerase specialized sigma24 family protein